MCKRYETINPTIVLTTEPFIKAIIDCENVKVYNVKKSIPSKEEFDSVHLIIVYGSSVRQSLKMRRLVSAEYFEKTILIYEKSILFDFFSQNMFYYTLRCQTGEKLTILKELLNILHSPSFLPVACADIVHACKYKSSAYNTKGTKEEVLYSLWELHRKNTDLENHLLHMEGALTLEEVFDIVNTIGEARTFGVRYNADNEDLITVFAILGDAMIQEDEIWIPYDY